MSYCSENQSLDSILNKYLKGRDKEFVQNLIYGSPLVRDLVFDQIVQDEAQYNYEFELKGYSFLKSKSDSNSSNVRVGLFQNSIVLPTTFPVQAQKNSQMYLGVKACELAAKCGVQILCFQETWNMPLAFCTSKKLPWTEFAEDAETGFTTNVLKKLAAKYQMVIVSPILERDDKGFLWNSAVVIDGDGKYLGKSRKNHIPISGKFNESYYYNPSTIGHPVFQTIYGRIAVSICYDRHHPQNWFAFGLNGAQIVFNPSATIASFSESLWPIESRSMATSCGFYTCSINRVGQENFPGLCQPGQIESVKAGPFFGSSFVNCPDGRRTPGLSTNQNGLLVADLDLNLCKDSFLKDHQSSLEPISQSIKSFINS